MKAYKYLYDEGVIHRDMKPDNVLYNLLENGELEIKICDFGLATNTLATKSNTIAGTRLYLAPEILTRKYDDKVDIYPLGVMMFELLIGDHPIEVECDENQFKIDNKAVEKLLEKEKVAPVLIEFIMRCI